MNTLLEDKGVRSLFKLALLSLALFLLALFAVQLKGFRYVGADVFPQSTISVEGEAELFVVPDTAEFTFSVIEEAEDFASAQEAATLAANDIIAYLEEAEVDRDDIKTTNYSINPRYEYRSESLVLCTTSHCPENSSRVLVGYEVNQTTRVKTQEIEMIGELVAGVGSRGASRVSSVNFTIEDEEELLEDVRSEAIADARQEAKRIASSLDAKLGRVLSYSDQNYYPYARSFGYGGDLAIAESAAVLKSPDIAAGENRLSASVTVVYELR